jgi:D-alanyl-D-alanine carboxypeptidase
MLKKICSFLVFIVMIAVAKNAEATTSSIMVDAKNGDVIYENNADELRYPASLTKLMTLYITFNALENKHIKLTDKLKVSRVAASRSPSKLGVRAGGTITVQDAIMAVIVKSANDCASVLAERFAKNEAEFAVLMTQTARKLGMKHTTFKNASGLPNSQQKTTARDMSILAMAVYHHFPQYYKWFSAQSFVYNGQKIYGHNRLLKTFAGADGMKTGYTAAAGFNIVTSAVRNNRRVIAVTMGHQYVNERDKKVALMMDKGLQHLSNPAKYDIASVASDINYPQKAVRLAKAKATVTAKQKQIAGAAVVAKPKAPVKVASATMTKATTGVTANGKYAIQVGSFSNYQRAKNYAVSVKQRLAKKYAVYNIKVEKVEADSGTVYRSKVVGLAKNDATKICSNMKRQKEACFVVADNDAMKLAQK